MTARQKAYAEYLKSEHWRNLRQIVIKRDGLKCTRCPARTRLQAHHKFYRDRFEDSVPDDLITLCRQCHEKEHGLNVPTIPTKWTWKSLIRARSLGKMERDEFIREREILKQNGAVFPNRKRKRRFGRRKRMSMKRQQNYERLFERTAFSPSIHY